MRTFTAALESKSPYSPSHRHDAPKLDKESPSAYDLRTWREHCTVNEDSIVCIPAMAFKQALDITASKLGIRVPGKGTRTWGGYFLGGLVPCVDRFPLGIKKSDVPSIDLWCNSLGRRGASLDVSRRYPVIPSWKTVIEFDVLDNSIPESVIEHHLTESGLIVGVGRFRPANGGFNGRYVVKSVKWSEAE
jgi:hypothetical protein